MGRSIGRIRTQGFPAMEGGPAPIVPTENTGIMSGAIRRKGKGRRDERGSRRGRRFSKVTQFDGSTKVDTGKIMSKEEYEADATRRINEGIKRGIQMSPEPYSMYLERQKKSQPRFDPSKPSAVMETERVNVQDPTLGGPPEREVPMPKERDTSPRGPAPFSPDERAMARDAFFEKMFSRADERKQSRAMDQEERRNVMDARRDEAAMRGGERGMRDERGGRRRMRRRDFTRRRSQMEGRRSREERAAFRDRFVSTLR